jgi:tRNA1Val (adenine37-N6)-methyltransferase
MNSRQENIDRLKQLGQERDIFFFKQFHIKDDRSTMKVGTDAVLLGIAAELDGINTILEIGTGCGVIPLILAQRSNAKIDSIEIDEQSAMQANENILASTWSDRIRIIHSSLQKYLNSTRLHYDLIISNPPFFSRSFKSSIEKRNISRHDDQLSFEELLQAATKLLKPEGKLWIILPVREGNIFQNKASLSGFHLHSLKYIIPKSGKSPNRIIMSLASNKTDRINESNLTLRDPSDDFSKEYRAFAHDFYIDF